MGNKVTNTNTTASTAASNTIKIVQVGNQQPRKTIAIMPSTSSKMTSALTTTTTSNVSKMSTNLSSSASESTLTTKDKKRKLEEMEEELERDRLALEEKMAKIRRMKAEFVDDNAVDTLTNDLQNDNDTDTNTTAT